MALPRLEPAAGSALNDSSPQEQVHGSAAKGGAVPARTGSQDPALARLVEAWPELPEHVRAAIESLVRSALASQAVR